MTLKRLLYSSEEIAERVEDLGRLIASSYADGRPVLCVCVLRGAAVFFADLIRQLKRLDLVCDFVKLSSYVGDKSSGKVETALGLSESAAGRHVLIVEDIVETGLTLTFLRDYFAAKEALDVRAVCLLDKPCAERICPPAEFCAFRLPGPVFAVGYGMDLGQRFRELDAIYEVG